ncbi:TerS protein [Pusillimonas sp. TS35]|nr:TerS protein [Pusillimonas sp. TS35]
MGPLQPPACVTLRPGDKPFWDAITKARARHTWNEGDLITAANLARTQADIEALQKLVDAEGYIVEGKINPAAQMVETLTKRVASLSRILHVHAEATLGRARDNGKTLGIQEPAAEDDDLIPTLRAVK